VEEFRGRWWNGAYGRMARKDLWLWQDGAMWTVGARHGDADLDTWRQSFDREAAARALIEAARSIDRDGLDDQADVPHGNGRDSPLQVNVGPGLVGASRHRPLWTSSLAGCLASLDPFTDACDLIRYTPARRSCSLLCRSSSAARVVQMADPQAPSPTLFMVTRAAARL
jgi:hypothetical protein